MALEKTLSEAARAVQWAASSKGGSGTSFRLNLETDLYPEINSAFRELREECLTRDVPFYVEEGSLTALPTSRAGTSENYSVVDWPTTAEAIVRVDVLVNGYWDKLERIDWENLREVTSHVASQTSSRPTHYSPRSGGSVSAATQTAGKLAIAPFCSTGRYKLSTVPHWTDLTDTTHKFLFPSEAAFRWMVWNVVGRIACRDRNLAGRYQMATQEMAVSAQKIGRLAIKTVEAGGTMRRARRRWG
jgi:hypothetical protein